MPAKSILKSPQYLKDLVRKTSSAGVKVLWPLLPRALYQDLSVQSLNVALTRICNVNCVFCPYQFAGREEKRHMEQEVFERVIEGIGDAGIRCIMLAPDLGEPFLAPDFMDKVGRMREAGVELIQVTTNATVLQRVGVDEIVSDAGPDLINISLPGFDEEAYRRVYRSSLYDQVRDNVLGLLRANDARGRPKIITVRLRGDLPEEKLLAPPEVGEVMELADDVTVMTAVDDWIGTITEEMLPGELEIQKTRPPLTGRPCSVMFNLTVHPDGDLHLCSCRNIFRDPDLHIGNIKEMSVEEGYRAIFGIMDRWEEGHIPRICHNCSMYCDPAEAVLGRLQRILARKLLGKYYF